MENDIRKAWELQKHLTEQLDDLYLAAIQRIQEQQREILKPDLGTTFVRNCARDLAGEIVRNYFDTSSFNITVDQMAERILHFKEEDYNSDNAPDNTRSSVYQQKDITSSQRQATLDRLGIDYKAPENNLDRIISELDSNQAKLFEKIEKRYKDETIIKKGKEAYAESRKNPDGTITDEYTGKEGEYVTDKNGNHRRRLEVDHVQAAATATYNRELLTEKGVQELKLMMNSAENFAMMEKVANASKGDVRVYDKNGNDITHRATPEQMAEAVCERWEKTDGKNAETIQKLKDKGYLNEDGKVPSSVKEKLKENIRRSQNAESKVILKNTKYSKVGKDALKDTRKSLGNLITGQIIYYTVPPVIYEVKTIVKCKGITLSDALERLSMAGKKIIKYVAAHLKDIFKNVAEGGLKNFIKSFMDILIGMVKATVKKILTVIKRILLSVVDAIKVIVKKGSSPAEKADAVTRILAVTVTNIVLEILFEAIEKGLSIPEFLLSPLQIITSVVCTNFVMLMLEKADLFNVKFGFTMNKLEEMFERERMSYEAEAQRRIDSTREQTDEIMSRVKADCDRVCRALKSFDPYEDSVRETLEEINEIFDMNIDFETSWNKFLGIPHTVCGAAG